MGVRAKFTVTSITATSGGGKKVVLQPQYDQNIPEDQRYSKATPAGRLEMTIDNPGASEQFEQGKAFYLDFSPVE